MCRVLSVKHSSYYDWLSRDISAQQINRNHCELLVKAANGETHERYGVERLHAKLTEQGYDISLYMVEASKKHTVSNAVVTSVLKSPRTLTITSLSIQTYWIKSLMLSVLMRRG